MRREEPRAGRIADLEFQFDGRSRIPAANRQTRLWGQNGYEPALWNSGGVGGRAPGNAESMDF